MQGLSFREYLALETGIVFEPVALTTLLENHTSMARAINEKIKPFQHFENYLKRGYYPYYKEQPDLYQMRLGEVLNMMLEIELPLLRKIDISYVGKVKQLLAIIAAAVPFQPNVTKLSEKIGINRNTLLAYFHYLDEIGLTKNLFKFGEGISLLQKPIKTYLENTNPMYLLARENVKEGNIRETFFANQLAHQHALSYTEYGDFKVNDRWTFEIGGKSKTAKQLQNQPDAYTAIDDITVGSQNRISLWLFGFLY